MSLHINSAIKRTQDNRLLTSDNHGEESIDMFRKHVNKQLSTAGVDV